MKEKAYLLALFILIMLFLFPLASMRGGFVEGDNFVQFYPWFKVYSDSVKDFRFPFWTRFMQSGFPLMAEGQVGGYYPFNILFFFFLPLNAAHNYSVIFHFLLAGFSMYFLSRKTGAGQCGALLAGLIFCFGSSYAGCFYNIITLRTLSWVPLVFLLFENYFRERKNFYMALAGLVFGLQLLAGFVQAAFYSWAFYALYYLYKIKLEARYTKRYTFSAFFLFSVIAGIVFLPQLVLTSRLISFSSRANVSLEFALWGSFSPLGIVGSVFPYWARFVYADFYLSVLGILFLVASFFLVKKEKVLRPYVLILVVSFLCALGKYNPLYVIILKITKVYGFRNPSKLLFFSLLSCSVLAGRGFTELFKPDFGLRKKVLNVYAGVILFFASVFVVSKIAFSLFKEQIIRAGMWYAENFIHGRAHHRYDLEVYFQKVHVAFEEAAKGMCFLNVFNIASWILAGFALALCVVLKKGKIKNLRVLSRVVFCIIVVDLFIYSFIGTGFRGNIAPFSRVRAVEDSVLRYLQADKELFRVLPYDLTSEDTPLWARPNANILYGIDSVAGYTPLANGYYRRVLGPLEVVDDSLGVVSPADNALDHHLATLRLLNVKYIVSAKELDKFFLETVLTEGKINLYRLKDHLPRVFVSKDLKYGEIDRRVHAEVVFYGSGVAVFRVNMPYEGFMAFSENNYPGWKVFVDGEKTKIVAFGVIQAVKLDKGKHEVKFIYSPYR